MDDILKLAKDYSKKRHLDLLPHGNNNILENLDFMLLWHFIILRCPCRPSPML